MQMTGILKNINVKKSPPFAYPTAGNRAAGASFFADFLMNPTLLVGGVAPSTVTRATIATMTDFGGVVRQVKSGEMRFNGMRRVENLITGSSENFTNASWTTDANGTTTYGFTGPAGILNASKIVTTAAAVRVFNSTGGGTGFASTESIWLKGELGGEQVEFGDQASRVTLTLTTSWVRYSRFQASAGSTFMQVRSVSGGTTTFYAFGIQRENVTGQSNQNPAEHVPVGVLPAPAYNGAGADGVIYSRYQNGNTVVGNVVTEAQGAIIPLSNAMGLLPESAATDLLLARADARDMTTANWALGATLTRARTQTGADGVANTATLLTGGAVAATNRITMTFALAAASRTYSLLLKRGAGTGAVLISQDNFATSTDISAQLNTSTFTKVAINANQLNPVIGIQVSVNADTVIADWNQYETGDVTGLVNSRIPVSITTRNADVLAYALTGWFSAPVGSIYCEWFNPVYGSPCYLTGINDTTSNNNIALYADSGMSKCNFLVATGGVSQALLNTPVISTNTLCKAIGIYQANDFAGYVNNSSLGTDVAGTIPTVTQIVVGSAFGGSQLGNPIRKVIYYPTRLPNAIAQALTV